MEAGWCSGPVQNSISFLHRGGLATSRLRNTGLTPQQLRRGAKAAGSFDHRGLASPSSRPIAERESPVYVPKSQPAPPSSRKIPTHLDTNKREDPHIAPALSRKPGGVPEPCFCPCCCGPAASPAAALAVLASDAGPSVPENFARSTRIWSFGSVLPIPPPLNSSVSSPEPLFQTNERGRGTRGSRHGKILRRAHGKGGGLDGERAEEGEGEEGNSLRRDDPPQDISEKESTSPSVQAALSLLRFYKSELFCFCHGTHEQPGMVEPSLVHQATHGEISPWLPGSCRFVPTCSEYSMIAFQKYGFWRGGILTAWRLLRCNPFGEIGFDPPRWFGEPKPPRF